MSSRALRAVSRPLTPSLSFSHSATPHANPSSMAIPAISMPPPPPIHQYQRQRTRLALPSVLMRSGTSKGLFLHRRDLPSSQEELTSILLSAMGSRDGDSKQLDGIGGATSTTSKVAIVSKSTRPGVDLDYTFAQVGVGSGTVDFSGNCGNICSGVGPFALDEGLVTAQPGQSEIEVTLFNNNTSCKIVETLKVGPDGKFCEDGDFKIGGVKGTGSQIVVQFVDPAGTMTDKLFPTDNRQEQIAVSSIPGIESFTIDTTLIDAANPFCFVDASTMPKIYNERDRNSPDILEVVEAIRRVAAVRMGLAPDEVSAGRVRGTPKIAILSPPKFHNENLGDSRIPDIHVTSYSMGKLHSSFQLTGAVCLAAAVSVRGTVAAEIASKKRFYISPPDTPPEMSLENSVMKLGTSERRLIVAHGGGQIEADVKLREGSENEVDVERVTVSRTARRLFEGNVLIHL